MGTVDQGIIKRGLTIMTVAPTVLFLMSRLDTFLFLIWLLHFLGMVEWTAMKRHLKVQLLTDTSDNFAAKGLQQEFPVPVAKTNLFIFNKCLACSLVCPCAVYSPDLFHLAMICYFFFWIVFTLMGQNKAETNAEMARKKIGSPATLAADASQMFHQRESAVIAEKFTTELFMSFCLEYFGFVWITGLSHALLMFQIDSEYGPICVIICLVSNWSNDIAALITGKSMKGRTHPLYPRISPNKSLEGAIAGVLANGVVAAALIHQFGNELDFILPKVPLFFFLGLVMGVMGVIGDLLQSLFKRTAKIKDTGGIFPGHGGVLDRIDGLLVVLPPCYWLLWGLLEYKKYIAQGDM